MLPFLDADTVVLVGQYRYVARDFYWEMPTGGVHAGETRGGRPARAGRGGGLRGGRLVKLCLPLLEERPARDRPPLPGEGPAAASRPPDDTEFIEVRAFPLDEVVAMVERCEIEDSMTVIAVLHAARRRAGSAGAEGSRLPGSASPVSAYAAQP